MRPQKSKTHKNYYSPPYLPSKHLFQVGPLLHLFVEELADSDEEYGSDLNSIVFCVSYWIHFSVR